MKSTLLTIFTLFIMCVLNAQPNSWLNNGPYGGYITALAINPIETNIVYAGTHSGMYKSTNGGMDWVEINDGFLLSIDTYNPPYIAYRWNGIYSNVTLIRIDELDSDILYVGTKRTIPENSHVKLTVFDLSGRLVAELMNQNITAGTHKAIWNGKDNKGRQVSSGVYLYTITAKSNETGNIFTQSNKMVLLK